MKPSKNQTTYDETYNIGIAETYYQEIKKLIKSYFNFLNNDIINKFIATGNINIIKTEFILHNSGLYYDKATEIATNMVTKVNTQVNAGLRKAYIEASKPIPPQIKNNKLTKNSYELISQQVQKIRGLCDYQYIRIEESAYKTVVEKKGIEYFKTELKSVKIYDEKRIKNIAYNQLHYATNIININKALDLGIERGTWRHPSEKVYKTHGRPSHIEANGKSFKLNKGCKIDGEYIYPAQLINCKCYYTMEI